MFMVDNCLYLLNLGHKLAHLSHMNMEKFDPLTCSFSPQYHPWVTHKRHEKKANDQQQKELLIFIPILLVSTFGYMSCIRIDKLENFWQNFSRFVICDVVPFWRWLTHGNVSIRPWLFKVWITLSTGEISIWWITQYVLLSFIPWITIYLSCWIVLSTLYTTWPKSNINRQSTHHKSNLVFQKNVMPLFFLMGKSWILFRGS